MFENGHVFGPEAGAQPGEIVVEDDVEDPVEPIFDSPVGSHCAREGLGTKACLLYTSDAADE